MNKMTPSADLSIVTLVMNASLVVKIVMGILVFASLLSWATIFSKGIVLSRAMKQTNEFEKRFWSGADLAQLFETATSRRDRSGAEERIFAAGMTEYLKLSGKAEGELLSGVRRGMNAVYQRELDDLERGLPLLASIGSVSPYIGLFGTVWGIMNAFTGLSTLDNVSLAVVAPGIAEALVATAIGLFAAIPATAAYNYFATRLDRITNRFDSFSEEFLNILARQH
ncbi:MAG: protein TolQ [Duodenibacillus sp.]|nr:protein TolQ [Duodenibacillus sp.]